LSLIALLICALAISGAMAEERVLTGQLLVASERMRDPRFAETVIYIVEHDRNGAFGLIVNRPHAEGPISALLENFGLEHDGVLGDITVHNGGPVDKGVAFILHSPEYIIDGTLVVDGLMALTSRPEVLRDIGIGKGPRRSLLAFGYSGWGPRQLDGEVARGDWLVIDADPEIVFGANPLAKWRRAIDSGGGGDDFI
jgi:putative transcriptional regulator